MSKSNKGYNNSSLSNKMAGLFCVIGITLFILFGFVTSTENYAEGERIGFLTKFSKKGRFWKSWEGELNLTQTGMNTSSLFNFSIDNDDAQNEAHLTTMIDSAVNNGWKVKLTYHQTFFKNFFKNRGETSYFIKTIEILDRSTIGSNVLNANSISGSVIDTIYVVIDKNEFKNKK